MQGIQRLFLLHRRFGNKIDDRGSIADCRGYNMKKIIKGDNVQILLGKDRGKTGQIERVLPKDLQVLVGGVNVYKRHVKGRQGVEGGIIDLVKPLNISNVALICPNCKKMTRVGFKITDGVKLRFCKKCGKEIGK